MKNCTGSVEPEVEWSQGGLRLSMTTDESFGRVVNQQQRLYRSVDGLKHWGQVLKG